MTDAFYTPSEAFKLAPSQIGVLSPALLIKPVRNGENSEPLACFLAREIMLRYASKESLTAQVLGAKGSHGQAAIHLAAQNFLSLSLGGDFVAGRMDPSVLLVRNAQGQSALRLTLHTLIGNRKCSVLASQLEVPNLSCLMHRGLDTMLGGVGGVELFTEYAQILSELGETRQTILTSGLPTAAPSA